MEQPNTRTVRFQMRPQLLSRQLGSDLYSSPADALCQLVANCLDANCSRVDVDIEYNDLGGVQQVSISDDGCGMSPQILDQAFGTVGHHVDLIRPTREVIGSRGIGRFAVFALAAESRWETVAAIDGTKVRQSWAMGGSLEFLVTSAPAQDAPTGTTVTLVPKHTESVLWLLTSSQRVRRSLFNAFASYLLRYRDEVVLAVNGEELDLNAFIDDSQVEDIEETERVPAARLNHLLLSYQVEQDYPCMLQFATHGATIRRQPIDEEIVGGKKYLGLVDSPYLSELTNTAKSELAMMDEKFRALEAEASSRAKGYIESVRGDRVSTFLEKARGEPFYPYKNPPRDIIEGYNQTVYDNVLVSLEQEYRIDTLPSRQKQLIFLLANQLQKSEDLAEILTNVLKLKGEHVARFAELLKSTSLSSIIAVSELLVGRIQFLDELRALVYGKVATHVKERRHLHKIIEGHTWLFGEQYNLMGSDSALKGLLEVIRANVSDVDDEEARATDVDDSLRDIPDLYLLATKWNEGAKYHQHLIVEMKRPSVRIVPQHVGQLERYAAKIVKDPLFGQRPGGHKFTFVLVSSQVSESVKDMKYQDGEEPGCIGRPSRLGHPTELWTLQWSDYVDRRHEELRFLRERIEMTADPEALAYLRKVAGDYLPPETNHG